MEDVKEIASRTGTSEDVVKKVLQMAEDPLMGEKVKRFLSAGGENVGKSMQFLADVHNAREIASANPSLRKAVDRAIYLHMSPKNAPILKRIITKVGEMNDKIHVAGKNPPVTERYDIEEEIHVPEQNSVRNSVTEILKVARTLRDKHGVKVVDDPFIPTREVLASGKSIKNIINAFKMPTPGYTTVAHNMLLYTAKKRKITDIVNKLKEITVQGRITKVLNLKLTKKDDKFITAKKASSDCTSPGGMAFDTFTIPALLSNSIGNLEIRADAVWHNSNPSKKGTYKVLKNSHVGNISFMVGKTGDGKNMMYIHHIELKHPFRLTANADDLAGKIVDWLSDYARSNKTKILAFDPTNVSNYQYLADRIYSVLGSRGAKELRAEKIIPLDHATGEKTTLLNHYRSPWVVAMEDGRHPLALRL